MIVRGHLFHSLKRDRKKLIVRRIFFFFFSNLRREKLKKKFLFHLKGEKGDFCTAKRIARNNFVE